MDIRRERKRSLKVREQQQAELDRIDATKKRYDFAQEINHLYFILPVFVHTYRRCQKTAETMAVKRQSPAVRQKEAEAMAVKRQSPAVRQKEAEAMAVKRMSESEQQTEERRQKDAQSKKS